jgi:hypothetical protein
VPDGVVEAVTTRLVQACGARFSVHQSVNHVGSAQLRETAVLAVPYAYACVVSLSRASRRKWGDHHRVAKKNSAMVFATFRTPTLRRAGLTRVLL